MLDAVSFLVSAVDIQSSCPLAFLILFILHSVYTHDIEVSISFSYLKTLCFPIAYNVKSTLTVLVGWLFFLRVHSIKFNKYSFELLLFACL